MSSHISVPKPQAFESSTTGETTRSDIIAAAYNAIAAEYDSQLAPAQWIRERLWKRMDILFPPNSIILDVTAGTGLDVSHLTEHGVSVVACDISSNMLDVLRTRHPEIKTLVSDFNHLGITGKFDGIISTFAGLNTSSDLGAFAEQTASLIRPGGILFVHLLNRWPVSNIVNQFARFRWRDAWQTLTTNPRNVNVGNVSVLHYLYSPKSLYQSVFARKYRLSRIEGQGVIRPLHAKWGRRFDSLERRLASLFPFHSMGVFFSLELSRVS